MKRILCITALLGLVLAVGSARVVTGRASPAAAGEGTETFSLPPGLSAAQHHTATTDFDGSGIEVTISGTVTATHGGGCGTVDGSAWVTDAFYYNTCGTWLTGGSYAGVEFGVVGDPALGPFVPPFDKVPP